MNHSRHPFIIHRFPLFILGFILISLVGFSSSKDEFCKHYKKYKFCRCGEEFANIVEKKHFRREDRRGLHRLKDELGRVELYQCRSCSICPSGVKVDSPCWENRDTKCSRLCTNPSNIYDPATKSCQTPSFVNGWTEGNSVQTQFVKTKDDPAITSHSSELRNVTETSENLGIKRLVKETNQQFNKDELDRSDVDKKQYPSFPANSRTICIIVVAYFSSIILIVWIIFGYLFRHRHQCGAHDKERSKESYISTNKTDELETAL